MIILFLLFVLGQVGRISLLNQTINFYLYEVVLLAYLIYLFFKYKLEPIKKGFSKFKSIYYFCGFLAVSFAFGVYHYRVIDNVIGSLYLSRLLIYFLFFIYFSQHLKQIENKNFEKGIFLFSSLTLIVSIAQYFLYPNLRNLYYLGWDPHQYRVFGLFFDTSVAAAVFGLIFLNYLLRSKNWLVTISFLLLSFLTYSRGFYVAFIASLLLYLAHKRLYKIIPVLMLSFIIGILILPRVTGESTNLKRVFSIESRIQDDKRAIEIWSKSPILGVGYNRIEFFKQSNQINHSKSSFPSSFLIILVTSGVVGLILFLWVLLNFANISSSTRIYVLFISVISLFDNVILQPFVLFLFLLLISYEINLSRILRQ